MPYFEIYCSSSWILTHSITLPSLEWHHSVELSALPCHLQSGTASPSFPSCTPHSGRITLGTAPGSLWAATLDCHPRAPKHFPRAVAEGLGLPGVDWLPGAPDSGQQCVNPGSKPPDHSYPLPASGT